MGGQRWCRGQRINSPGLLTLKGENYNIILTKLQSTTSPGLSTYKGENHNIILTKVQSINSPGLLTLKGGNHHTIITKVHSATSLGLLTLKGKIILSFKLRFTVLTLLILFWNSVFERCWDIFSKVYTIWGCYTNTLGHFVISFW